MLTLAATGSEVTADDSQWQAVGSRKTRPQVKVQPKVTSFKQESDGVMFESVVESIMEKYQMTR